MAAEREDVGHALADEVLGDEASAAKGRRRRATRRFVLCNGLRDTHQYANVAGRRQVTPPSAPSQPAASTTLPLAGSTFGYLHHRSLSEALDDLARNGLTSIELTPAPPHLHPPALGAYDRRTLRRRLERLGLTCLSVNPSFADINLISTNPEFRELSLAQIESGLELAEDLEAPFHVVVPGRRHALAPAPAEDARAVLLAGLERLLRAAERHGVTLALENSPYGFLGSSDDLVGLSNDIGYPRLRLCYDVANGLAQEDPAAGVRAIGERLGLAHVSDTPRAPWRHTSPGRGEVDFAAFAAALRDVGYAEPTVYELVDEEDPAPRLADDLLALEAHGWTRTGAR
jgi:sugar phosphate isomerase/epimerase